MVQHSIECSLGEDKWLIKEYKVYIFGHRCLQRFSLTKIKNGKEKNAVKHSGTASLYPQQKLFLRHPLLVKPSCTPTEIKCIQNVY